MKKKILLLSTITIFAVSCIAYYGSSDGDSVDKTYKGEALEVKEAKVSVWSKYELTHGAVLLQPIVLQITKSPLLIEHVKQSDATVDVTPHAIDKPLAQAPVEATETPEVVSENKLSDETEKAPEVDKDELYMLSHLIYAEVGSDYISDKCKRYAGSVVLNRMKSDKFPDTMKGVIFQDGQYACTLIGTYYNEPSDRCVEIARELLTKGSAIPDNVVFQAEFKQGDGVYDKINGTYFCYID